MFVNSNSRNIEPVLVTTTTSTYQPIQGPSKMESISEITEYTDYKVQNIPVHSKTDVGVYGVSSVRSKILKVEQWMLVKELELGQIIIDKLTLKIDRRFLAYEQEDMVFYMILIIWYYWCQMDIRKIEDIGQTDSKELGKTELKLNFATALKRSSILVTKFLFTFLLSIIIYLVYDFERAQYAKNRRVKKYRNYMERGSEIKILGAYVVRVELLLFIVRRHWTSCMLSLLLVFIMVGQLINDLPALALHHSEVWNEDFARVMDRMVLCEENINVLPKLHLIEYLINKYGILLLIFATLFMLCILSKLIGSNNTTESLIVIDIVLNLVIIQIYVVHMYRFMKYMWYTCTDKDIQIKCEYTVSILFRSMDSNDDIWLLILTQKRPMLNRRFGELIILNVLLILVNIIDKIYESNFEDLCVNHYLSIDDFAIVETFGNDIRIILQIQLNIIYILILQQQLINDRTGNITTFIATALLEILNNVLKDKKYEKQYKFVNEYVGCITIMVQVLVLVYIYDRIGYHRLPINIIQLSIDNIFRIIRSELVLQLMKMNYYTLQMDEPQQQQEYIKVVNVRITSIQSIPVLSFALNDEYYDTKCKELLFCDVNIIIVCIILSIYAIYALNFIETGGNEIDKSIVENELTMSIATLFIIISSTPQQRLMFVIRSCVPDVVDIGNNFMELLKNNHSLLHNILPVDSCINIILIILCISLILFSGIELINLVVSGRRIKRGNGKNESENLIVGVEIHIYFIPSQISVNGQNLYGIEEKEVKYGIGRQDDDRDENIHLFNDKIGDPNVFEDILTYETSLLYSQQQLLNGRTGNITTVINELYKLNISYTLLVLHGQEKSLLARSVNIEDLDINSYSSIDIISQLKFGQRKRKDEILTVTSTPQRYDHPRVPKHSETIILIMTIILFMFKLYVVLYRCIDERNELEKLVVGIEMYIYIISLISIGAMEYERDKEEKRTSNFRLILLVTIIGNIIHEDYGISVQALVLLVLVYGSIIYTQIGYEPIFIQQYNIKDLTMQCINTLPTNTIQLSIDSMFRIMVLEEIFSSIQNYLLVEICRYFISSQLSANEQELYGIDEIVKLYGIEIIHSLSSLRIDGYGQHSKLSNVIRDFENEKKIEITKVFRLNYVLVNCPKEMIIEVILYDI